MVLVIVDGDSGGSSGSGRGSGGGVGCVRYNTAPS